MSGRSSRGGRGDGRAPWRRWCGGRLGADDRLGDLRAFLFDGAADLEGLPGAAEGGEGELVEDDVGGRDDPPDGGDVDEVFGAPRVVAEVDALETSGGEVVRAERLGEDAGAVAEHHLEVLEGVVARVAAGDLDRRPRPIVAQRWSPCSSVGGCGRGQTG